MYFSRFLFDSQFPLKIKSYSICIIIKTDVTYVG